MSLENMTLRLIGERPLLMNSSVKVDPLNPINIELGRLTSKRDKTAADHEQIAKAEWHAGLWLLDGKPCIPSDAVESAFSAAARTRRKGKQAKAGGSPVPCRRCWSTKVPGIPLHCGKTKPSSFAPPSTAPR